MPAMLCIACGREGHNSSRCPLQLWRRLVPAPAPAPTPASRSAAPPRARPCVMDSHDRTREPWLQFG